MSWIRCRFSGVARPAVPAAALLTLAALLAAQPAAATVTSTRPVAKPPYYHGKGGSGTAARLPVGVGLPESLPGPWIPVAELDRLAADMEAWLTDRELGAPLLLEGSGSGSAGPAVYLGCALDELTQECSAGARANVLAVTSASKLWRRELAEAARRAGVDRVLVVRLDVAPHWIRQKGLKGAKQVALGTGHHQELPWLTSLDTPVWVLQVTGVLVDVDGRLLRSGGEGVWAIRTPFKASMLGAQRLMTPEDVEFVRAELRRPDLEGAPLGWQAALDQLTRQLLGP